MVGVERCGGGKWADIKKLGFAAIAGRSAVDLKDKWRNLMRVALLPAPGCTKCAPAFGCCLLAGATLGEGRWPGRHSPSCMQGPGLTYV